MDTKCPILIVDDDRLSREVLARALETYDWAEVAGEAANVDEALDKTAALHPGIIFLDIELNDESALDVMDRLRSLAGDDAKIVFYTSYKKYLMQALRLQAFDFLIKPIDPEELSLIMSRCRLLDSQEHKGQTTHPRIEDPACGHVMPTSGPHPARSGLSVTTVTNDRMILFPRDIVFFRYDTDRKLWEVVLTSLQHFILKHNTTADTILNYGPQFVRTHKSFIVNVAFIGMISGNECRLIPPYDKLVDIRISKIYRRQLLDRFYDI